MHVYLSGTQVYHFIALRYTYFSSLTYLISEICLPMLLALEPALLLLREVFAFDYRPRRRPRTQRYSLSAHSRNPGMHHYWYVWSSQHKCSFLHMWHLCWGRDPTTSNQMVPSIVQETPHCIYVRCSRPLSLANTPKQSRCLRFLPDARTYNWQHGFQDTSGETTLHGIFSDDS